MTFYIITVAVIISLGAICLVFAGDENTENVAFLNGFGWRVEPKLYECETLTIPEEFDDVYNNYNELQKLAGLDISPYKGCKAKRYTYIVTNFPLKIDDTVYANVLCVNNKPVAGDIMTVPIDGFMYSLNYLNSGR